MEEISLFMRIFEAIMLICFGAAWPMNIMKSIKSKTAKGKSVLFLFIILFGYLSGILNKVFYDQDIVLILYIINFFMVLADIVIWFRNKRLDDVTNRRFI